jgi:hypothetical protein
MTKLNRCAATALVALGLTAPLVIADDHSNNNKRYYDKSHKDYHQWNANEDKSYSVFLSTNNIQVHAFSKAKPTEQQQYWNWRHDHPDEQR